MAIRGHVWILRLGLALGVQSEPIPASTLGGQPANMVFPLEHAVNTR